MTRLTRCFITGCALLAFSLGCIACEKKQSQDPVEETVTPTEEAEPDEPARENLDIPQQFRSEAEQSITEDNAEQAAAELEKEIDSDQE